MINEFTAPRNVWEAGESWTLADQARIHVMQERIPPGSTERQHLHGGVEQLYSSPPCHHRLDLDHP